MTLIELFLTSVAAMRTNVLRTFLMMLGIVIGVGAVIVLTAATEGAQQGVSERIRGLGSDLLFVRPGAARAQGGAAALPGLGPSLFYEDAIAIGDAGLPYIDGIAASTAVGGGTGFVSVAQVIYRGQNAATVLVGTEASYQTVRDHYVTRGRFVSEDDVTKKALVVVLGSNIAERVFPTEDPIGQTVRLFAGVSARFGVGFNFMVIGVMEPKGTSGTGGEDDRVFVPLPSIQARVPFLRNAKGYTNVTQISIKLSDRGAADKAKEDIGILLKDRHESAEADFTIETQGEILETATAVDRSLGVLVASIASIALVVGGICIMAIMLISVTERTREIGIRKALGAKRIDILLQFLIESLLVTLVGGAIGVGGGYLVTVLAEAFDIGGSGTKYVITPQWVLVGLGVSAVTGVVAGVYPAWLASRLDPIEALRHE